jgi:hypothetical protein
MTINDLCPLLVHQGVRPDAYCLTGGLPNEAYTIERLGNRWRTYYSERGNRTALREFANESDTCRDLLARLLSTPDTA